MFRLAKEKKAGRDLRRIKRFLVQMFVVCVGAYISIHVCVCKYAGVRAYKHIGVYLRTGV